jgi:CRP-like cAMP-binding protein
VKLWYEPVAGADIAMENHFLRSLAEPDYAILVKHLKPVELAIGTDLYMPEDRIDWVYFPTEGLVSLINVMLSGAQVETGIVGREGGIGFQEAAGSGIIFYRAVVQLRLKALRAPAAAYIAALDTSVSLRRAVADHVELNLAESRQLTACQAHHNVDERMAWWLLECLERTGLDHLPLTHEFLSAMLGVQRTTVTETAKRFRDEGLIGYSRGVIDIHDRAGLERRSCECYRTNRHYRDLIEGAAGAPTIRRIASLADTAD